MCKLVPCYELVVDCLCALIVLEVVLWMLVCDKYAPEMKWLCFAVDWMLCMPCPLNECMNVCIVSWFSELDIECKIRMS